MVKDYQAVVALEPLFSRFSWDRFCWARLVVSSRVFGIVV